MRVYKDYEFRMPTEAEWMYAYLAGTDGEMEEISDDELKAYWSSRGNANWQNMGVSDQDAVEILKKKPNALGIFNMVRVAEDLVDTIALPLKKNGSRAFDLRSADRDVFAYADFEENPIRIYSGKPASHIARVGKKGKVARPIMVFDPDGKINNREDFGNSIRLVFGPALDKLNVYPMKDGVERGGNLQAK